MRDLPIIATSPQSEVYIDYTNWRGKRAKRCIRPISIKYGSNEWHPAKQWLLVATDVEANKTKEFAMAGIHGWAQR